MPGDTYHGEFSSDVNVKDQPVEPSAAPRANRDAVQPPAEPGPDPEFDANFAEPEFRTAGVGLLVAAAGAAAGYYAGGVRGAAAGALLTGAARNGYRSGKLWGTDQQEANKSATVALLGLGGGGYMAYLAYQAEQRI